PLITSHPATASRLLSATNRGQPSKGGADAIQERMIRMGNKQLLSRSRGSMTGFVFWGALVASAWGIVGVSPLTAQDDKAPKLLISNQKTGPGEKPKASFTLRPNLPNQPFYLFVQNPDTVDKKVVVEVRVNGAPVPGGRAEVQVGPGKTAPVAFGKTP